MTFDFPLDKLAQDFYDVVAWHLLFLLPQWCFILPPCGGTTWHRETWIQFKHFLVGDSESLKEKFFL
jgi:hypothetical protein